MNTTLAVALTSHLITDPAPISSRLWRSIKDNLAGRDAAEICDWASRSLNASDAAAITARLAKMSEAEEELDSLASDGVTVLLDSDPAYPQKWIEKLGGKHPILLFVAGNTSLLNLPAIGVVGSRDVDEPGAEFTKAVAEQIVSLGYETVSGGARGVDQIAMRSAADAGGGSIGILSDSMHKVARGSAEAFESGRVCLATPYSPYAGFQVGNAMGRNKLIYAMSDATVVVSSAEGTGGTWAGAIEALEDKLCAVLVRTGAGVPGGNLQLVKKGGVGIETPTRLGEAIESAGPQQAALF